MLKKKRLIKKQKDKIRKNFEKFSKIISGFEKYSNKKKNQCDKMEKLFEFKNSFFVTIETSLDNTSKKIHNFIEEVRQVPEHICTICTGLFHLNSVRNFEEKKAWEKFKKKAFKKVSFKDFVDDLISHHSKTVCKTCNTYLLKGKIPKKATKYY